MSNGFSVAPDDLPDAAAAMIAAGTRLHGLTPPRRAEAGRSTDEVAAAVLQLVREASSVGTALTELGAAFEAAARSYAATDDAVADALLAWGP
jgi:hypothetical protein